MNKILSCKTYKRIYRKKLAFMMNTTWNFEEVFCKSDKSKIYSIRLVNLIFDWYLLNSNYKQVAFLDEALAGFLFAFDESKSISKIFVKIKTIFFYIKSFILWIFGFYGNKKIVKQIFLDSLKKEELLKQKAFKNLEKANCEIISFFVKDSCRGNGIGNVLLNNLTTYCKKNKIKFQWLVTDTDCNYQFYEKSGFDLLATVDGKIGQLEMDTEGKSFLYSKFI
jgi:GNAT superfamily N-acetyltransferase